MNTYGVPELAQAMVNARRFRDAAPQLRDHHARRLAALQAALGMRASVVGRREADALSPLLEATLAQMTRSCSPFDSYLEAPASIHALHFHHAGPIRDAANALHRTQLALLIDLLGLIYGIAGASASVDEVARHGFDPTTREPEIED
jgi:hypothetical protein